MIRCEICRRRFGGVWGFKLAHPITLGRCRSVAELRATGLRRNRRGVWVRQHSRFQVRLIDARVGGRVREWFGRSYRSLSDEDRSEYRGRLARSTKPRAGERNAQTAPERAGRGPA